MSEVQRLIVKEDDQEYEMGAALLKRQNVAFVLHAYNSSYI